MLNVLLILSTVLIPVKASQGFKPTVATAQADTFIRALNVQEAYTAVQKLYEVYDKQKSPACPKLVIIDENTRSAAVRYAVVYKAVVYEFTSAARAVDALIKLHLVLGLPFSKISKLVWIFVEKLMYSTETDYGGYLSVHRLINYIQQHNASQVPNC